jgi:enoyl-CoA hydratase
VTYSAIELDTQDDIGVLTFNRPKVLNAFNTVLVREVGNAMARLSADDNVKVVLVRGAGRAFSAGFDLKESAATAGQRSPQDWRDLLEADYRFIMSFWDCPKPTIAVVHGYCIGGAFELSLACDMTVAAAGTRFGSPEVKFGSGAVALLLPWIAGPKAAKELLLTGDDKLSAERALQLGIVNHVVPDGQEYEKAMAIARDLASAATNALRLTKVAVNRSYETMGMKVALEAALEIDVEIESSGGEERAEFDRIRREENLQAALVWRNARR